VTDKLKPALEAVRDALIAGTTDVNVYAHPYDFLDGNGAYEMPASFASYPTIIVNHIETEASNVGGEASRGICNDFWRLTLEVVVLVYEGGQFTDTQWTEAKGAAAGWVETIHGVFAPDETFGRVFAQTPNRNTPMFSQIRCGHINWGGLLNYGWRLWKPVSIEL
jgi:hypothetical protein